MYRWSFDRIVTRKDGLPDPGNERCVVEKNKGILREKDELTVSASRKVREWELRCRVIARHRI